MNTTQPLSSLSQSIDGGIRNPPSEQRAAAPLILIIEPTLPLYNQICVSLEPHSCSVHQVNDGFTILHNLLTEAPSLIILGPTLSPLLAYALCVEIRKRSHVPLVMFANHHQIELVVRAYELGIDCVVSLPFAYKETQARLMALLRRCQLYGANALSSVLSVGAITLNEANHTVTVEGLPVSLTPLHYQLLRYLMKNVDRPVNKEQLLLEFWGSAGDSSTNVVEVAIRRLRQKIETDPSQPTYLLTVRGVGYRFASVNGASSRHLGRRNTRPN